jgi:heptosyltransferase-3
VAHELPLRILGAVLARAGLFVGNDSGVSHLAAAAGAPTLSLFGPTAPEVWSPLGPRVVTLRAPGGAMSEISVDEVAAKAAVLR